MSIIDSTGFVDPSVHGDHARIQLCIDFIDVIDDAQPDAAAWKDAAR